MDSSAEAPDEGAGDATGTGGGASAGDGGSGSASGGTPGASGGTPGAGGGEQTPSYAEAALLIERSCATQLCHGGEEEPAMANDASLPQFLLGTYVEECGDVALVTPGQPENSALLKLVKRECGELFMPDNCSRNPCLPDPTIAAWTAWIASGAPMQ